jgi:hypothetical protein
VGSISRSVNSQGEKSEDSGKSSGVEAKPLVGIIAAYRHSMPRNMTINGRWFILFSIGVVNKQEGLACFAICKGCV